MQSKSRMDINKSTQLIKIITAIVNDKYCKGEIIHPISLEGVE